MKTKVLHIYNIMNRGGAETFIMNVYNNIDHNLFQFDFLCTSSISGDYDENIKNNGGQIFRFNKFSSKKIISNIIYTYKILKKNGPYDVIHIPMQFYSWVFCLSAKFARVKKIIVHSHSAGDYSNARIVRKIYMSFSRFLINVLSTNRIACGNNAGKYLYGTKSKFEILYNGIDLKKFGRTSSKQKELLKQKYDLCNKDIIIGHVGNFSLVKNHMYFIKIAKELKLKKINFKILLIGDGNERINVEKEIKRNNLTEYFSFTGNIGNVNELYVIMDIFVMTSLYEGFPVSIIEALASGIPCVLSDTITKEVDIIKDECIFFNLNESIESVCDIIYQNSSKKFNYISNQKMLTNFDISTVSKKLIDYYCK